jgi:hypothetical protein
MKTYSGLLLAILSLSLLTGCTDSMLTLQDRATLFDMRGIMPEPGSTEDETVTDRMYREMTFNSHTTLAKEAHKNGDNRLIAFVSSMPEPRLVMPSTKGPLADTEETEIPNQKKDSLGVKCDTPIEIIPINMGCVPPPVVYIKMMMEYNKTLLEQPNFPHKDICHLDKDAFQEAKDLKDDRE